jgi:hypothetical protein
LDGEISFGSPLKFFAGNVFCFDGFAVVWGFDEIFAGWIIGDCGRSETGLASYVLSDVQEGV